MVIFRNDDVNPNTDFLELYKIYDALAGYFPGCQIWSCVNIFARANPFGTYPENQYAYADLKTKPAGMDFAAVDKILEISDVYYDVPFHQVASHGLWHMDHRAVSQDLQAFSIRTSCGVLGTKVFVPPFMRWNARTREICAAHNITLWGTDTEKWVNLDNAEMRPGHELYLFHSWKFKASEFIEKIRNNHAA